MITPSDSLMADHELEAFGKPWLLVTESYYQTNLLGPGGRQMYRALTGEFINSDRTIKDWLKTHRVEIV